MNGWALVDGRGSPLDEARIGVMDAGLQRGWSVFESIRAEAGEPVRLDHHLDRLSGSCQAACLPEPDRGQLAAEIREAARQVGGLVRVRVQITGSGTRIVLATPLAPTRLHRPVVAARGVWRADPYLPGAIKHGSRAGWLVALERARRAAVAAGRHPVEEVLLVDDEGRFREGTTTGILAVIDGVLWAPPHDGSILESTAATALLRRARALGLPLREAFPPAAGPWDALYVASSGRELAPVVELDGEPLPGWDPVGRALADPPE